MDNAFDKDIGYYNFASNLNELNPFNNDDKYV